jgi:hypothetical protein
MMFLASYNESIIMHFREMHPSDSPNLLNALCCCVYDVYLGGSRRPPDQRLRAMNSDKSEVQAVLVDVPKYDKDGNLIPLESWSSGGARNTNGALIALYDNPRVPEPANEPEFDERLNREYDTRRRHEEDAEERRRKEYAERVQFVHDVRLVYDNVLKPYVIPLAKKLWDTKVLPGGKRLAQRWLRPKRSQPEVPHVSGDTPEFAAETANPLATSQLNTDHTTEMSTDQAGGEDSPLADVIQMDEYQDRRSA